MRGSDGQEHTYHIEGNNIYENDGLIVGLLAVLFVILGIWSVGVNTWGLLLNPTYVDSHGVTQMKDNIVTVLLFILIQGLFPFAINCFRYKRPFAPAPKEDGKLSFIDSVEYMFAPHVIVTIIFLIVLCIYCVSVGKILDVIAMVLMIPIFGLVIGAPFLLIHAIAYKALNRKTSEPSNSSQ